MRCCTEIENGSTKNWQNNECAITSSVAVFIFLGIPWFLVLLVDAVVTVEAERVPGEIRAVQRQQKEMEVVLNMCSILNISNRR